MATYLGAKPGLAGAKRPSATANAHLMRLGSQWRLRLEAPIAGAPAVLHPAPVSLQSQRFGTLHRRGACVASAAAADPDPQRAASATPPHASSTTPGAPQPTLSAPAAAATSAAVTVPLLDCVFAREEEDDGEDFAGSLPPGVRVLEAADSIGAGASATGPAAAAQPHAKSQSVIASGTSSCCGGGNGCGVAAAGPVAPRRVPFVVAAASVVTETRPGAAGTEDGGAAAVAPWDEAAEQPQTVPGEKFDWYRQWYPVAPLDTMDPARPHPFTLLGQELVLWRDGGGTWRAFEDACPHRLVPLSEGRIEKDGTLLCAYHAWRFDGGGKCTSIPQVEGKEAEERAFGSPRSCARVFPTQEAQGLLWVWGESGPSAAADSASKGPALIPEMEELPSSRVQPLPWFFRDLPYSYDFFVENVTDPAHVNVSHHNVAGNRYAPDQYFSVDPLREVSAAGGFKYAVKSRTPVTNVSTSSTEFLPPSLVKIKVEYSDGAALILALYSCPTTPGHNRHVGRQILIKTPEGKMPRGLAFFALPMPKWLGHATASVFLHQDQVFLHQQERIVAGRSAASHTAKYFMPAPSDNMTVAFRTWLGQHAGGGVPYAGGRTTPDPIDRSKESLFDTYHTHTAQCAICKPALGRLQAARTAAVVLGAAALVAALMVTGVAAAAKAAAAAAAGAAAADAALSALTGLPPLQAVIAAAVALAAAAAVRVLDGIIGLMHRYEFSHADNH